VGTQARSRLDVSACVGRRHNRPGGKGDLTEGMERSLSDAEGMARLEEERGRSESERLLRQGAAQGRELIARAEDAAMDPSLPREQAGKLLLRAEAEAQLVSRQSREAAELALIRARTVALEIRSRAQGHVESQLIQLQQDVGQAIQRAGTPQQLATRSPSEAAPAEAAPELSVRFSDPGSEVPEAPLDAPNDRASADASVEEPDPALPADQMPVDLTPVDVPLVDVPTEVELTVDATAADTESEQVSTNLPTPEIHEERFVVQMRLGFASLMMLQQIVTRDPTIQSARVEMRPDGTAILVVASESEDVLPSLQRVLANVPLIPEASAPRSGA
jgi:hypothetical protein